MKQVILILSLFVLAITKSFAADPVSSAVEKTFQSKFAGATDVKWSEANGYTVANFVQEGKKKFAYFTSGGELVVVAEPIHQLSADQQESLEESFRGYTITEAYKMKSNEGTRFYLVIENQKESLILNNTAGGWEVVKRNKK